MAAPVADSAWLRSPAALLASAGSSPTRIRRKLRSSRSRRTSLSCLPNCSLHAASTPASEAFAFLNPEVAHLHDPLLMLGMKAAVERVERAIARKEPILLYGDYDVDGTTAVVLLKTAIELLGGVVRFHVPHRLREGYGLQSSVLEAAYAEGVRLVITVDTGMRAFAEAETAHRLGLDLIITDHHLRGCDDAVPIALAILNPNQHECGYPEKSLCGAAIALKLAQALLERHDAERTREKLLPSFLKMAAIATIADAVPLRGENRVIAALGLRELRTPRGRWPSRSLRRCALDPATKPSPASTLPSASPRASTPPAAWTWPQTSSSSSPPAMQPARPNWPPSSNA